MSIELLFVAVIFLPTVLAFLAWLTRHNNTTISADSAPITYWGSYQNLPALKSAGCIPLPETHEEEPESSSHMHTIGVHP